VLEAEPGPIALDLGRTALVIIDMQRDFLEAGGFGETLGNDVSRLAAAVEPCRRVLAAARDRGMLVVHTREGHRPDLTDAPRPRWSGARRRCASARRDRWAAS
jgi:nicotinamidase-related amidase